MWETIRSKTAEPAHLPDQTKKIFVRFQLRKCLCFVIGESQAIPFCKAAGKKESWANIQLRRLPII